MIPLYDVKELDEVKQRGEGGFGEVLEVKVRLRHGVAAGGAAGGAGGGAQQERLPLGAATPAAQGMNGPSGDHQNSGGAADHGMLCSVAWKRVKGGANVDEQQEMLVEEARSLLVFESDRLVKCLGERRQRCWIAHYQQAVLQSDLPTWFGLDQPLTM